jgi:hypothetical protein
VPLALLYHCNLGVPIISPDSRLLVRDIKLEPRGQAAAAGLDHYDRFEPPQNDYQDQVFFHRPEKDSEGFVTAAIINPQLGLGVQISWLAETKPVLSQWKMMGKGAYACGLEPVTHAMGLRNDLLQKGLPEALPPEKRNVLNCRSSF